jgi:ATP-dependent RNA helicase DHX57
MPKNAHPPRGKPAKKTVPPEEDTSYIVFGDGKPKKKKPDTSNAGTGSEDTKGKGKAAAGPAEDGPKKPDTRTLIAGASWTGKLPVNLLAEHFQKQHWSKPDYRIVCTRCATSRSRANLRSAKMARSTLPTPWSCPN